MPTLEPTPVIDPPPEPWIDVDPAGPLPRELWPDLSQFVTSDDTPVDSIYAEMQQRLLIESLYASWVRADGQPFRGYANVGLFYRSKEPAVVPDAMFAIGIGAPDDPNALENRSYFTWIHGRPPDVVLEIVSDRRGGEDSTKLDLYHQIGVPYYIVYDPWLRISTEKLRTFARNGDKYRRIDPQWLAGVELGLTLWHGEYEGMTYRWLRWIDQQGQPLPTSKERIRIETQRAEAAEARIRELEAKLKAAGG